MQGDSPGPVARVEGALGRLLAEPGRGRALYVVGLLAFTLIVWLPALFGGLGEPSQDAFYHITSAALHHTPGDIAGWFARGYWAYTHYEYRPLTRVSLLVDYLIWGRRLVGFHLTNVLLHFACAFLLAAAMARAGAPVWGARLSGLVAAVFPAGQMAVSWINGRQDVLCAALLLGGVVFFLSWLGGRGWPHLVGAAGMTLLAALAKEPGAAAPVFLLGAAFLAPTQRTARERIRALALVSLPLAAYLWVRWHAWPLGAYMVQNAPQLQSLKVSGCFFFGLLVFPRPHEWVGLWRAMGSQMILSPGLPAVLAEQALYWASIAVLARCRVRLLALAVLWKVVFFVPVHNLYWNPVFTHYRYLPQLGTCCMMGLGAWELGGSASRALRSRARPLLRWSAVAMGMAVLLWYYAARLDRKWPPWSVVLRGGPAPPASFGRDLQGEDAPFEFDEAAIRAPAR